MTANSNPQLPDRLREAGLKATGPRLAILGALVVDESHPSAEQLFESLRGEHPSLSLSTVYNTLEAFLHAGLCRRVNGDGSRLRVDGITTEHDHAHCRGCGRIFDIERSLYPLPPPPETMLEGLSVTGVRVEYDVICPGCTPGAYAENRERVNPARTDGR